MAAAGAPATVHICVVGDDGVGKTSLITAAATETFPDHPPPVLPPAKLPADTTPEGVPVVITDTSSRPEDKQALELACQVGGEVGRRQAGAAALAGAVRGAVPGQRVLLLECGFPALAAPFVTPEASVVVLWLLHQTLCCCRRSSCICSHLATSQEASVIVLCFSMDKPGTLRRVSSYWMPELRRLGVHVPVMLVGCKSDVRPADRSLHEVRIVL